jgi:hypothetical protein
VDAVGADPHLEVAGRPVEETVGRDPVHGWWNARRERGLHGAGDGRQARREWQTDAAVGDCPQGGHPWQILLPQAGNREEQDVQSILFHSM